VQGGRFRQDLFYRLNVIEIAVPALRDRREDLPALCAALLARIAHDAGMEVPVLSRAVIGSLAAHPLQGNVRELENLLHRAVALNDGEELHIDFEASGVMPFERASDFAPMELIAPPPPPPPFAPQFEVTAPGPLELPPAVPPDLQTYLDQQEREILVRALRESGFNRTAAAARLGLSLRQIRYRIARLGIGVPNGNEDATAGDE
jgi:two-component system response regulator PilR (NtrC family)